MKKTIYIADSYSLNTGDIGILVATISEIRKHLPDARIYVESSHPAAIEQYNLGCTVFRRIFDISKLVGTQPGIVTLVRGVIVGLYDSITFMLFGLATRLKAPGVWMVRPSRRAQARAIKASDVWLSSGGGYLSSFYRPMFRFYGFQLARTLRVPYVIFAQSVGPFMTKRHRILGTFFLNRARAITIREDDSMRYVQKLGLKTPYKLTADIAFLLPIAKRLGVQIPTGNIAAICVKKSNQTYEESMLHAAKLLVNKRHFIYFVSQTPNDDKLAEKLQSSIGMASAHIPFGLDAREVKMLYGQCKLIIAARMHALIFAAEQGVPWIGIGYEPKFRGLSKQLGKTGILIEEKELTPASIEQALQNIPQLPKPLKHPAEVLAEKARENTGILLTAIDY